MEILWLACHNPEINWKKRSKDNKISRRVWEAMKIKVGKVRVAKTKRRRKKRRRRKQKRNRKRKNRKKKK